MEENKMFETKKCSKCKRELPLENFRWKNKSEGKKHSQCKECQRAQEKLHYQESISRRESVRNTTNCQKADNIRLVEKAKASGCIKCGEKRSYVLDFHHRESSTKIDTINHMIKSASVDTILNELKKCDVLCANCHREFHYLNLHNQIEYEQYLNNDYTI